MTTTILTDEEIDKALSSVDPTFWDVSTGATEAFARAIEQAVLQSEQVQAWKKDAEGYRYIKKGTQWIVAATQTGHQIGGEDLDDLIDSEMGRQNDT